jgi:hypothetical protein
MTTWTLDGSPILGLASPMPRAPVWMSRASRQSKAGMHHAMGRDLERRAPMRVDRERAEFIRICAGRLRPW